MSKCRSGGCAELLETGCHEKYRNLGFQSDSFSQFSRMDHLARVDWHTDPNSLRGTRLLVEPPPEWVVRRKVSGGPRIDAAPVTVLLVDRQINPDLMSRYTRYARRLETPQSVQEAGRIEIDFDPATQKLSIHAISIFRDGKLDNYAELDEIKIIQRERELDKGIYDGNITALILLKDLRTGDVIDVETSITSDDAIFPSHYWFEENFEHTFPVNRQYFSWLSANQERFQIKDSEITIIPTEEETTYGIRKTWEQEKRPLIELPSFLPLGYNPFKCLAISSFKSWQEVAAEMSGLWKRSEKPGEDLPRELATLKEKHGADELALIEAVVAFVRDQIRYQGVETGRLGLVPDELFAVWDRRYGDCKEKTSMLCWMLRECGFEATPALVSTAMKGRVSDHLPSPIFDHVVVHLLHAGTNHWIDPTDISRRGSLHDWTSLPFQKALLISERTTDFLPIKDAEPGKNLLIVEEEYSFPGNGCDAEIDVKHTYYGTEADRARHALDSQGRVVVQQIFTDIIKSTRPKAELKTDLTVSDDQRMNVLSLEAKFFAPDTLVPNQAASNLIAEFVPHSIVGKLVGFDNKNPIHPLGLFHPVEVKHSTILRHPDTKGAVVPKVIVDNEFIKFVAGTENSGEVPVLTYHFLTKASEIPVKNLSRYRMNLSQISKVISLTYETRGIGRAARSKSHSMRSNWEEELNPNIPIQRGYSRRGDGGSARPFPYWLIGVILFIVIKIILLAISGG